MLCDLLLRKYEIELKSCRQVGHIVFLMKFPIDFNEIQFQKNAGMLLSVPKLNGNL